MQQTFPFPYYTANHIKREIVCKFGGPNNECWESIIPKSKLGRYTTSQDINGRSRGLHRLVYESIHGEIPTNLVVMHSCDNPPCINPDHLSLGTQKQNMQDCSAKGRVNKLGGKRTKSNSKHIEFYVSESLLEKVDEYKETNYLSNRTAAIIELIRKGLNK